MAGQIPEALPRVRNFEQLGFGLFLHYGLYSMLGRGEWARHHHKLPADEYNRLADTFTAAEFDAPAIVSLAKAAGMKYICLTSRHHDGYSLYDTQGLNAFDAPHTGPKRDLIREYADACHAGGIGLFLYHTTLDWLVPSFDGDWPAYLAYLNQSVELLCRNYGKIDGLWFDGNWARRDRDWKEGELYSMIRRLQPECIIINNSSTGALGKEGHPELDAVTFEQGRPGQINRAGKPKYVACEMCETFTSHWGIARRDFSSKSPAELIRTLCACRRFGANMLLNVGPTATGAMPAYESAALRIIGEWIATCAPCIYTARPTDLQCKGEDFVLQDGGTYYYFLHGLAIENNTHLAKGDRGDGMKTIEGALPAAKRITWTDGGPALPFVQDAGKGMLAFNAGMNPYGTQHVVRVAKIET